MPVYLSLLTFFQPVPPPNKAIAKKKRIQGEESGLHELLGDLLCLVLRSCWHARWELLFLTLTLTRLQAPLLLFLLCWRLPEPSSPAVPAGGPWVQLVTQCDAENNQPGFAALLPPELPPLPTQRQPTRRKACRLPSAFSRSFWSPAALAIAAAPEAREQWSLLSAARPPPSGQLRRLDAPSRAGEWFPRLPPAPGLGLSQGQAPVAGRRERGGGTILCFRRSQRHIAGWAREDQPPIQRGAESPPAPEGEGATSAQGPGPHSKGSPAAHPGSECAN